jgi:hypothetical protein
MTFSHRTSIRGENRDVLNEPRSRCSDALRSGQCPATQGDMGLGDAKLMADTIERLYGAKGAPVPAALNHVTTKGNHI